MYHALALICLGVVVFCVVVMFSNDKNGDSK